MDQCEDSHAIIPFFQPRVTVLITVILFPQPEVTNIEINFKKHIISITLLIDCFFF